MRILEPQKPVTIFKNDNLGWRLIILALLILFPLYTIAQGIPKAYEPVNYSGKVNGQTVRLILASGYIGASLLNLRVPGHHKPIVFEPDQGVGDEKNRLKFVPFLKGRSDYFIMDNMQDSYEENPGYLAGRYYLNHQVIPVKFLRIKH